MFHECLSIHILQHKFQRINRSQMLFTWSTHNLCIVFRQWRITGPMSLLLSLVAIALLTAGYECVREVSRKYEQSHSTRMSAFSSGASSMPLSVPEIFDLATQDTEAFKVKLVGSLNQAHCFWQGGIARSRPREKECS